MCLVKDEQVNDKFWNLGKAEKITGKGLGSTLVVDTSGVGKYGTFRSDCSGGSLGPEIEEKD